MGCVYNRGTRAKPNWWIKWTARDGRPCYQKIGEDHALAKAVLAKKEHDEVARAHGVETDPPPPCPRFAAAAEAWIKQRQAPGLDGQPAFRSWRDDQTRINLHLLPTFGRRLLDEITIDDVRRLIDSLRPTHKPQTIRNVLHTLSRLYEDQPKALRLVNPVRQLDRNDRRRIGKAWDPTQTPFLRTKDEVRTLILAFPDLELGQPFRAMYAVGALAGLRPGEVRALEWADIDFANRLIHVQRSDEGPTKDDDSRHVPLVPGLAGLLKDWRKQVPLGKALVFPPVGRNGKHVHEDTFREALRVALAVAKLDPALTTYEATRHTFGAQWVINGGSLLKLSAVLGHSSTVVTQRYGHLLPGEYTDAERALVDVDLRPAKVLPMRKRG